MEPQLSTNHSLNRIANLFAGNNLKNSPIQFPSMADQGISQFLSPEKIGPRRLRAAIWLFFFSGFFLFHAGSDPTCDYGDPPSPWELDQHGSEWLLDEPDCEPGSFDELGYDFLDTTGLSKSTANTTGFFILALTFLLVSSYRKHFPNKGLIFDKPYQRHRYRNLIDNIEGETPEPEPEKEEKWWED